MSSAEIIFWTLLMLGVSVGCPVLVWAWALSLVERTTANNLEDQLEVKMPRREGRPQPNDPLLDLQERLMNAQAILMDLNRALELLMKSKAAASKETTAATTTTTTTGSGFEPAPLRYHGRANSARRAS